MENIGSNEGSATRNVGQISKRGSGGPLSPRLDSIANNSDNQHSMKWSPELKRIDLMGGGKLP